MKCDENKLAKMWEAIHDLVSGEVEGLVPPNMNWISNECLAKTIANNAVGQVREWTDAALPSIGKQYETAIMDALAIAERLGDVIRDQMPAPDGDSSNVCQATLDATLAIRRRLLDVENYILTC